MMDTDEIATLPHRHFSLLKFVFVTVGMLLLLSLFGALFVVLQNTATAEFPLDSEIVIEEGESVEAIGRKLEQSNYIHSPLLFTLLTRYRNADTAIQAGTYSFAHPHTTYELIERLSEGGANEPLFRITFPEGYTVHDWELYTDGHFPHAGVTTLLPYEGRLFPDTYFVTENETLESLLKRMGDHYEMKVGPLRPRMEERGYSEEDVITLASILEREANDETSMRMVAGILENRLKDNMPLQVDAVFEYYTGKGSTELTIEDLEADTPYNTYTNSGLPPEPIGNPGLMAISAVLNPTPSDYYYYLTGNDGTFYYAKTFEEHKRNKARYLR